ncbi:MAG: 50S ribosomal protein L4 [Desulfobacterales bacterium]|nr:50S ribosomal protein L4 [Desulfobacterales bacterium]
MAVIDVIDSAGKKVSQVDLPENIFNIPVKSSVLHEVVVMQLAKRRKGSASVKHRADVKGSTRKLFRQKGTGRARRGDIKSPLLRGGGSVFGPDPRSYEYKIPKRVRRLALKMALSSKLQENDLIVMNKVDLAEIKTKKFVEILNLANVNNALIVIDQKDQNLEMSSRNIPNVKVLRTEGLNVYDILKHKSLILIEQAINGIEGRLSA